MSPTSGDVSAGTDDSLGAQVGVGRREFLGSVAFAAVGMTLGPSVGSVHTARVRAPEAADVLAVDPPPWLARTWLGPTLWANRLQDFRVANSRYECVGSKVMRTVALLTRSLSAGVGRARLSMRTGTLVAGSGFSGFLVGVGGGALDYRAAALAQAASGTGGGLLCTYESDGRCRFRGHTSETAQLSYPVRPSTGQVGPSPIRTLGEDVTLTLAIEPSATAGRSLLTLTARKTSSRALLSRARLDGVQDSELTGGLLAVSAPTGGSAARYWFATFAGWGTKLEVHPERAMGPLLGALFSLNGSILKMTAQLFPIGSTEPQGVTLMYRLVGTTSWQTGPRAVVGDGYTAQFRVPGWDTSRAWDYQLVYAQGTADESAYQGSVPSAPPTMPEVVVGVLNCSIHSYRPLDAASPYQPRLAAETPQGLYTARNLYFPYVEVARNLGRQEPHLLAALGDQYYENRPTANDPAASPTLDFLYKYYLWLWSFRGLTRRIPCVVLVDDHDMYQGNLWGHEGAAGTDAGTHGGYVKSPSWVNTVQRVQQGHNPDPYDPRPVSRGITVSYGAFTFGGVSFAWLEDRKFKYGPDPVDPTGNPAPIETLPILGSRQELFLAEWPAIHPGQPKLLLSQTTYAVVQTTPDGSPMTDPDNNAYRQARERALALVKAAGALMVCGDQHLGDVVRHGLRSFTDGPVQFTVPAAGSAWQRWFEPKPLPHAGPTPHTGDFTDGYGNMFRVLAVANPIVTQLQYVAAYGTAGHYFGDRSLKSEGYGIVRIDKPSARYVIECWRWDTDPTLPDATQFAGWPRSLPFANA